MNNIGGVPDFSQNPAYQEMFAMISAMTPEHRRYLNVLNLNRAAAADAMGKQAAGISRANAVKGQADTEALRSRSLDLSTRRLNEQVRQSGQAIGDREKDYNLALPIAGAAIKGYSGIKTGEMLDRQRLADAAHRQAILKHYGLEGG